MVPALLAALVLTGCGARTELASEYAQPDPVETLEQAASPAPVELPAEEPIRNMLPNLDAAALKDTMPETDYAAFETYLPILEGEGTFRWVAGPYDGYPDYDWEAFDADLTGFHDWLWDVVEANQVPDTLTLDRLAVQDVDGDGTAELALLFQDRAYHYLLLRQAGDECYGTSFSIRWFMDLQKNGVYVGSGGAGSSTYYRMAFRDGIFQQQELGHKEEWATGSEYELDGEPVTKETFYTWLAENMPGSVTWYAPDGSVVPENQ